MSFLDNKSGACSFFHLIRGREYVFPEFCEPAWDIGNYLDECVFYSGMNKGCFLT